MELMSLPFNSSLRIDYNSIVIHFVSFPFPQPR